MVFTDARFDNSFMELNIVTKTIDLGDGRPVTIETGKLAKQAHGSVVVRQGDTMLLAAAVSNYDASEGVDFLPLTVDYREKYASTGRFPGGFFKREARPSDTEILVMRLVDRALRPTFPSDYHAETQVMIQLMSADKENMPDSLAGLAASAALAVSDIPFDGPISEVRVCWSPWLPRTYVIHQGNQSQVLDNSPHMMLSKNKQQCKRQVYLWLPANILTAEVAECLVIA